MVLGDPELVEDPVGLPPPVVLGLGELGLSVVSVDVRPILVPAFEPVGLLPLGVSRAVSRRLPGELARVRLHGVRVEYLHRHGEVDRGHQAVDALVPEVVAKDEESPLDAARPREARYELLQVLEAVVDLHNWKNNSNGLSPYADAR